MSESPTEQGKRDYAVRVTHESKEDLILPTPQGRAAADSLAGKINGDGRARAEVVSRPSGGWKPEP